MIQVFSPEWFAKHQNKLLYFVNTKFGKRFFRIQEHKDKKIHGIAPNYLVWKDESDRYVVEFRSHDRFAKRLIGGCKIIWRILHLWDMKIANKLMPSLNAGFDTYYPDADPETSSCDGEAARNGQNSTFASITAGAGTAANSVDGAITVNLQASSTTDQFMNLARGYFLFDTSAITTNFTVSVATLSLAVFSVDTSLGDTELKVCSSTPSTNTNIVSADFQQVGATSFGGTNVSTYGASPDTYIVTTLDGNGRANVSRTGISKFGLRIGWDLDGTFGGTWASLSETVAYVYSADNVGVTLDPKLTLTLEAVATGSPSKNTALLGIG